MHALIFKAKTTSKYDIRATWIFFQKPATTSTGIKGIRKEVVLQMACGDF